MMSLVGLQDTICPLKQIKILILNVHDALEFNYSKLNLKKPIFFIGGLTSNGR